MLQLTQMGQIFRDAGAELPTVDDRRTQKEPQLELVVVSADASIAEFLETIFLLPLERAARFAFIDHLHLRLENRARALLEFVREASEPRPMDKQSAIASQWSLVLARKSLNLQSESAYGVTLAKADSIMPEFAEFVHQTTKRR